MAILVLGKTAWELRVDIILIVLFLLIIAARLQHVHHLDWINWSLLNVISYHVEGVTNYSVPSRRTLVVIS